MDGGEYAKDASPVANQDLPTSGGRSSVSLDVPRWLPAPTLDLLHKFRAIDKLYCMLKKRKLVPTLDAMRSYGGIFNETAFTVLLKFAHKSMSVMATLGSQLPELVLKPGGASDARSEVRGRAVLTSLIDETKRQFLVALPVPAGESTRARQQRELRAWQDVLTAGKLPNEFVFQMPNTTLPRFVSIAAPPVDVISTMFDKDDRRVDPCGLTDLPALPTELLELLPVADDMVSAAGRVLQRIELLPFYKSQLIHRTVFPSRSAAFLKLKQPDLPDALKRALKHNLDIDVDSGMFRHQALAVDALRAGYHLALATETASGKSLCYNIPVLEACLRSPAATAMYLFPTKSLAQDQLRATQTLCGMHGIVQLPIRAAIIDGDSSRDARTAVAAGPSRGGPHVILSNPDMLHHTLIPNHAQFQRLFSNLRYVVIDEAHQYRGTFGAHVACVLRRLVRVCLLYSTTVPQFITCSATISNPSVLFSQLLPLSGPLGGDTRLVVVGAEDAGTARGERLFALWNPPLLHAEPQKRSEDRHSKRQRTIGRENSVSKAEIAFDVKQMATFVAEENEGDNPTIPPKNCARFAFSQTEIEQQHDEAMREFLRACEDRHRVPVSWKGLYDKRKPGGRLQTDGNVPDDGDAAPVLLEDQVSSARSNVSRTLNRISERERDSPIVEIARLLAFCVRMRLRTLCFCGTRKLVEIVNRIAQEELRSTYNAEHLIPCMASYRGGYTAEDRREIEAGLFGGTLLGVVATCALELGVDVGSLDITLQLGFPGSFSSLWQQAGRAGRSGRPSLSILVFWDGPVDQYFARQPDKLLRSPAEAVILGIDNPHVIRGHLLCAAHEECLNSNKLSINNCEDMKLWGISYFDLVNDLSSSGHLRAARSTTGEFKYVSAPDEDGLTFEHPARTVKLRLIDPITIDLCDETQAMKVIDSMPYSRAFFEAFEGSVFYIKARQHIISKLNISERRAYCHPARVGYTTSAQNDTVITVLRQTAGHSNILSFGSVRVIHRVNGFIKRSIATREIIEEGEFTLDPLEMETQAIWIDIPVSARLELEKQGFDIWAALHAANHVFVTVAAVESLCDAGDLACEHFASLTAGGSTLHHTQGHRMLLYDKRPGGLGICEKLLESGSRTLQMAHDVLRSCSCDSGDSESAADGCPACLLDTNCSIYNQHLSKSGALLLLELLHAEMKKREVQVPATEDTNPACLMEMNQDIDDTEGGFVRFEDIQASRAKKTHMLSPREERRLALQKKAKFRDSHSSRGLFIAKPWGKEGF